MGWQLNLAVWGKLSREGESAVHPLACHCLDTGHVMAALWDGCLGDALGGGLSRHLGVDEESARAHLAFWASLHDIGKATPAFQRKAERTAPWIRSALESRGYRFLGARADCRHGDLTTAALRGLFAEPPIPLSMPRGLGARLATVLGGHHGVFPLAVRLRGLRDDLGRAAWGTYRQDLFRTMAEHWHIADVAPPQPPSGSGQAFWMVLAGLISVADWIASAEAHFPHAGTEVSLEDYVASLPARATAALSKTGWRASRFLGDAKTFADLFDFYPNGLQQAVATIAETAEEPSLVLVEAPMGLGKTEAAFHLLDRCARRLGYRGAYVALPTQATSNQMLTRFRAFLTRLGLGQEANLHLLHGQAMLNPEYRALRLASIDEDKADSDGAVVASEWFAGPKRGLLAPWGVGTVDQSLLAVLQTRHVSVRLFGLAGKVVILDEVHAYDTYTSSLLEHLIHWLGAMGCTVVLLSATLPRAKRAALVRAFNGLPDVPEAPYPRVTVATQATNRAVAVPAGPRVRLGLFAMARDPDCLAPRLQEALVGGGCAACICNTVGRAQETYRALREALRPHGCEVLLLHSRFPFEERQATEERIIHHFGKDGWRDGSRPRRAVLVSTQIVEQSLYLDFDLMVSDLAPADLVLQRAGRLHRHRMVDDKPTVRPDALSEPVLWLAVPPSSPTEVPDFGSDEWVYERYVLLRSYLALVTGTRSAIRIPDDLEAVIESVYGDGPVGDVGPAWQTALADAMEQMRQDQRHDTYEAHCAKIPPPDAADDILQAFNQQLEEDDPSVHKSLRALTRKASPSVTLVCLHCCGERLCLDSDGVGAIDLETVPEGRTPERLVGRSVKLTHRGVVGHFLAQTPPTAWRKAPLLRHSRPLLLEDGRASAGRYTITLDSELGILVEDAQYQGD